MKDYSLKVRVKKLHDKAVVPTYAKEGDAGLDLTATSITTDDHGNVVYGTGLAFEIPQGYVGLLFPRSSNSKKTLTLTNSVGVIDSGYRGEVKMAYKNLPVEDRISQSYPIYTRGERVGQLIIMPYPKVELIESESLSETERGEGGYGSTGK